jgi:hypothetical protein
MARDETTKGKEEQTDESNGERPYTLALSPTTLTYYSRLILISARHFYFLKMWTLLLHIIKHHNFFSPFSLSYLKCPVVCLLLFLPRDHFTNSVGIFYEQKFPWNNFWFYRFSPSCGLLTARVSVGFFFVKEKGKNHTNVSKLKSRTQEKIKEEK